MLNVVLALTFKIFIILLIGVFAARTGVIDKKMKKDISSLLIAVILPVSIISASQQEFLKQNLVGMAQSFFISLIYYVIAIIVCFYLSDKFNIKKSKKVIFVMLSVFANIGFIGFSIISEILGETGVLYTVIHNSVFQLIYFSYGINLFRGNEKLDIKGLLGNKIIWISIMSIILYLMPIRMPQFICSSLSTVGNMVMPLSMIIIGAEIGSMDLKRVLFDKESYLVSLLRMCIFPMVMMIAMKVLKVEHSVAITSIILTSLPSGSLNVIMADKYNKEPEFATIVVTQNMLFMIISLPIMLFISEYFL